ncbi:uncharacterized protein LOC110021097 [Phalaenopsis equestris]|uniref:uncharacterized protein LOC110021097 n=1 Tax=Phalaenopsis equestris TaxID=78828 RepID=UPI0009E5B2F5|nr:uncharacterized protein LOC110021097 [Phalaenopsis equestris]
MKQHMTYERRRIVRKRGEEEEGAVSAEAAAEIASRVFPLQTPTAAMLTVARKSSTRVFVPRKAITDKRPWKGSYYTRVLRSGKPLHLSEPVKKARDYDSGKLNDIRLLESGEKTESRLGAGIEHELDGNEVGAPVFQELGKKFENVYSRKRQRIPSVGWIGLDSSPSDGGAEASDPRYRFVFSRKRKKKKLEVRNGFGEVRGGQVGESEYLFRAGVIHDRLQVGKFNRTNLHTIDISDCKLWTSFSEHLVLVVLLESSSNDILLRFRKFLISVISWMRKTRVSLRYLTAFLLSEPICSTFSRNGIHFLPLADRNSKFLLGSSISNFGICKLYSARESLPLMSLNFLALPSYFTSLHLEFLLRSQHLSPALSTYLTDLNKKQRLDIHGHAGVFHVHSETDFSGTSPSVSAIPAVNRNLPSAAATSAVVAQSMHASKLRKLHRRRSFFRQSRIHKFSSVDCLSILSSSENGAQTLADPLHVSHVEPLDGPFVSSIDKLSPTSSQSKLLEVGKRNHGEQMKEIKAALSDIKQNIDSIQCKANILFTAGDRCWREEGAEVLLELSGSGEWCLAVKIGNNLRYLHRPQDMKYTLNRFNHAYMWIGEDGWRLEFCEKWDWLTFKELHAECRQRNNVPKEDLSVKFIPVPVFMDIPAYEDDTVSIFERPEQYIRMKHDDEILRATVSEVPYYDMDSGDEEWLKQHKSNNSILQNGPSSCLMEDTFERLIFTFEKNAYYSSNVISFESEPINHEELGSKDMVAGVYDYWLKKRKQKRAPLVRVFQGLSLRKPQLMQRQVLRKRRSFKRIRSQIGRGKPAFGFDSKAKDEARAEALHKLHEAEKAWCRSVELAIPLRRRAELLMENADLAAYKSLMALRISEALRSTPPEAVSSILDFTEI